MHIQHTPAGVITRIEARDADQQGTINSVITYKLVGANAGILNIDPSTGMSTS